VNGYGFGDYQIDYSGYVLDYTPKELIEATLPIWPKEDFDTCRSKLGAFYGHDGGIYGETKLCAGGETDEDYSGACMFDEGGPATVRESEEDPWVLAGIIGSNMECGRNGMWPTVLSNVAKYTDWIYGVINQN